MRVDELLRGQTDSWRLEERGAWYGEMLNRGREDFCLKSTVDREECKTDFHSNASACVGKQPIMVATASTEHSYWLALAFVAWKHDVYSLLRLRKPRYSTSYIVDYTHADYVGRRGTVGRIFESVCLSVCPWQWVLTQGGYVRGVYVRQSLDHTLSHSRYKS